jgi:pyrroloquinoline quinone biosynthesis protein E
MVGQSVAEDLTPAPLAARIVPADPPVAMLAQLTHRCPLQCPYCSNPLKLLKATDELRTGEWLRVIDQAAALGVLQVHLSGGEPALRTDLEALVARIAKHGLYSNLITSGIGLRRDRLKALADRGLDHVQLSVQSVRANVADRITNYRGALAAKNEFARWVCEIGLPLTINTVMHRHNIGETEALIRYCLDLGAERLEVANTQYYGWAAVNRAALMPTHDQVVAQAGVLARASARLRGVLNIDYVLPGALARPQGGMDGWTGDMLGVLPDGKVLPGHNAEGLADMRFESVRNLSLADIWYAFGSFDDIRSTGWVVRHCGIRTDEEDAADDFGCKENPPAFHYRRAGRLSRSQTSE